MVGLLSPSDYAGYADEGRRLAVDVPNVTPMDAARFIAEATPIIGDAMAAKEIYDEATSENPNWAMVGALGGAAVLGLFPGIGDAAAKAVKSGARGLLDTAKRVEVDPNAMGSLLGNVRLKPKGDVADEATSFPVMQGRSRKGLDNFFNPDGLSWGTTSRETAEQFAGRNEVYWPNRTPPESSVEFSGDVYDLNFNLKNPMDVDISQTLWDRNKELALVSEAKSAGYDGLRISHPSGKVDYVAFDPSQVSRATPPSPAEEISDLLASGRADEVTDEMLGKLTPNDNMELFELYQSGATGMDLPMDEASRMARAEAAGFEGNLFHGTGADIVNIDKEKFGLGENLLGKGFYTTSNPKRADIYVPVGTPPLPKGVFQSGNNEYTQGGNILPLNTRSDAELDARQKTGKANALSIGNAFQDSDFDVEIRDGGDQVFIKSKTNPDLSVYIDSYQDGMITLQKLKDTFGRGNVTEILEQAGFSGLKAPESSGSVTKVNYKPEDVRSKFARFDPRLSNLKNLSAGVALPGAGLLALQEMQKRANEEQQRQGLLQ